ncbi:MAG: hypothetical protein AB8G16_07505 [Gammaproteobacteria bacterium]
MQTDLDKLKDLLFANEKRALDALTRRLDTAESRTADVADVLPGAIEQSNEQGPALSRSLKKPLEDTLTEAITRDPHRFAVALYPVIGPAIRRAISEAMRSLVVSINRAIDTSLSPSTRLKARRAGVPLAEWVLRESILFRVDEVYLIDPRSGLLIEHTHHPDTGDTDEDAVSAMLTAIQDFARDSFNAQGESLNSAVIGDRTVWISEGPYAMIAAVIRGTPPEDLRNTLDVTVERLHLSHGAELKNFQGGRIGNLDGVLSPCLRYKLKPGAEQERAGIGWPLRLVGLALLAGIGFLIFENYQRERALEQWRQALRSEPGLVVTDSWRSSHGWRRHEHFYAEGLRDPLAADPAALAEQMGLPGARVHVDFQPFVSLEKAMIGARAASVLAPPENVALSVSNGTLRATGDVTAQWRERFVTLGPTVVGVDDVDASGLKASDSELFARIRRELSPPDSVQLSVDNATVTVAGTAPIAWVRNVADRLAAVEGVQGSDVRNLRSTESGELERLTLAINGHRITYMRGTELSDIQQTTLPGLARKMNAYVSNARALGVRPLFRLTGYTDGSGGTQANQRLRVARAQDIKARLVQEGVEAALLGVRSGPPSPPTDDGNVARRIVEVSVAEPVN